MKIMKLAIFAIIATVINLQAIDFKLKNVSRSHEIEALLTDPIDTSYSNFLGTLDSDGGEYSGSVPFHRPFYVSIFANLNPTGRMYKINVNSKTQTAFLEWDQDTKTLRPQKPAKKGLKGFFSKDGNIKQSEIIKMP